jgi:hypothetical protein
MIDAWEIVFDDYWRNRPGAPFGHNPKRVFEAGFLAGMAEGADAARKEATTNSKLTVAKAEAWDEGAHFVLRYGGWVDGDDSPPNPYREVVE